jgi:branched-chain amino acid transport system permease protein
VRQGVIEGESTGGAIHGGTHVTAETTALDRGTPGAPVPSRAPRVGLPAWVPLWLEAFLTLGGLLLLVPLFFPARWGIVLNGALMGGRIALIALGIGLIYRANRVVNFSQGDLGGAPAALAVMLVVSWGWGYWFGFVAGLAVSVVLGVLVETLVIRRFFTAPRLVLTVATIGLAQVLTGAGLMVPRLFDDLTFSGQLPQPFDGDFVFDGTTFNANDILTMLVVPVAFVALALFLKCSTLGVAIVGAAERADRAAGLGIPVKRLHTIVWVVASVLAFVAMFLRAGAVGLPLGQVLPPVFLVQALGAAVLGRFERFPTIAAAAIGLGVVDQAMTAQSWGRPAYNDAVLFVVVLLALLVVRRNDRGAGRVDSASSTWQATREVRAIPRELARLPEVWGVRVGLWVLLGVFVLTLPLWVSTSRVQLATIVVLFGIVAASLVVLTGWAGQVSLGHMAFVGIGAAVGGALSDTRGWILPVTLLVGGLAGATTAVVVGFPALRRRGLTLAVSTLAFALFTSSYLLNRTVFDWLPGRRIDSPTLLPRIRVGDWTLVDRVVVSNETRLYFVSVAVLVLALLVVTGLRRTRTGRVLIAIRENERAVQSYGVNVTRTTLAAFAISGFLAAVAGGLYVHLEHGFTSDPYAPERSVELFSMVVIGGLGSLPGALLGAGYVQGVDFFLPLEWQFLASGAGLLLVLLIFPAGLGSALAEVRDAGLRWVARRRNLVVPSLVADVGEARRNGEAPSPEPGRPPATTPAQEVGA